MYTCYCRSRGVIVLYWSEEKGGLLYLQPVPQAEHEPPQHLRDVTTQRVSSLLCISQELYKQSFSKWIQLYDNGQISINFLFLKHLETEEELNAARCCLKEQEKKADTLRASLSQKETELSSIRAQLESATDELERKVN